MKHPDSPCCDQALYEHGTGWWCPVHGDREPRQGGSEEAQDDA